ncbi:MAG: 30S ribosomal protein S9 [Promethearchaeia archaeon]
MSEKQKVVQATGKRKEAIAKATLRYPAKKSIKINGMPLDIYEPEVARLRILEVLRVAHHEKLDKSSITVKVNGGGVMGQCDAVRFAIAQAINQFIGTKKMENTLREYENNLLSGDSRRVEPKKFGGKKARARRQKSFR